VARRGRKHVELDAANQERVRRLLGPEALQALVAGDALRLGDLRAMTSRVVVEM
jgi:hypothetical protein